MDSQRYAPPLHYLPYLIPFSIPFPELVPTFTINRFTPDIAKPFSLRERLGVKLEITTSNIPRKLPTRRLSRHVLQRVEGSQGRRGERIRGTTDPAMIGKFEDDTSDLEFSISHNMQHLERLVPGLFICLKECECHIDLHGPTQLAFTHVIRISSNSLNEYATGSWIDANGTHRLAMLVPRDYDIQLHLDEDQLHATREYLTLALPYVHPPLPGAPLPVRTQPGTPSCVLISATPDRAADVVAVVATYLSFITGPKPGCLRHETERWHAVGSILSHINSNTEYSNVWRGAITCEATMAMIVEASHKELEFNLG